MDENAVGNGPGAVSRAGDLARSAAASKLGGVAGAALGPAQDVTAGQAAGQAAKGVATGAAQGAAVGGAAGAAVGAVKGAAKGLLSTTKGRALLAAVLAVTIGIPVFFAYVIYGAVAAIVGISGHEEAAQSESAQVVLTGVQNDGSAGSAVKLADGSDITQDHLLHVMDVASGSNVPWQVLLSLSVPMPRSAASYSSSGTLVAGTVPDDMAECPATGLAAESGLTPNALLVLRCGYAAFNETGAVTGWIGVAPRPANPTSDHPEGRAIDAMTSDDPTNITDEEISNGWTIAEWYAERAEALGIYYIIFDEKIWMATQPEWEPYTHPAGLTDPTSLHRDHVHVSVYGTAPTSTVDDGTGDGTGGGTSGTSGETGTITGTEGWGPFNFDPVKLDDSRYDRYGIESEDDADDFDTSAALVVRELNYHVARNAGTAGAFLSTGTVTCDDGRRFMDAGPDTCSTGNLSPDTVTVADTTDGTTETDSTAGTDDSTIFAQAAAAEVKSTFVKSIAELPIYGMTESQAALYYDRALAWYLGQEYVAPSGECVVVFNDGEGTATIPSSLEVTLANGVKTVLSDVQLTNAATIIAVGVSLGATEDDLIVALMTALQESKLLMYANSTLPASLDYPHDAVGSDHDSLGLFQQRPAAGWGTIAELMDAEYNARAFFGGPEGPNEGSPRGLYDIGDRTGMTYGEQAQKVQVSAYPTAYDKWEEPAKQILVAVGNASCAGGGAFSGEITSSGWSRPVALPWTITSPFGCRSLNLSGTSAFHFGIDIGAAYDTPIYAVADGKVIYASDAGFYPWHSGGTIYIDHGGGLYSEYNHMDPGDILVSVGDVVAGGTQIAGVGNSGRSTGPHLHMSMVYHADMVSPLTRLSYSSFVNPVTVMSDQGVNVWGSQTPTYGGSGYPACPGY